MLNKRTVATVSLLSVLATPAVVQAQQTAATLHQLQQQLDQQQHALENQREALARTRHQLQKLRVRLQAPPQKTASAAAVAQPEARPVHKPVGKAPTHEQEQAAEKVAAVMEQPGVLTPAGQFVFEPSLQYNYTTNGRVSVLGFTVLPAIVVGLIDVRQVKRGSFVGAVTARYGLTNRLEFDMKVPYVYGYDKTVMRPYGDGASNSEVFNANGYGLGDIQLALRYQINQGGPNSPYFIGSLRTYLPTGTGPFDVPYTSGSEGITASALPTELPTGSGFFGIEPGIQMIYPSDPVVLFAGLNYLWRIKDDVDKTIGDSYVGEVDPGDSISLNVGMGLALNERSSLSIAYKHTYITQTKYDGSEPVDGTDAQLGQLLFGYGYRLSPDTSLNFTIGAGLTDDTPDVSLTLRMPMQF